MFTDTLSRRWLSAGLLMLLLTVFTAPVAALTDMAGNEKRFEDLLSKEKWTVLEIWSSQCPACPDAVLFLSELKERYAHKTQLIGISTDGDYGKDGRQMAQKFIQDQQMSFPSLYSNTAEIDNFLYLHGETLYGTPTLLIFNPQGELKAVEVGAPIAQDIIDFIEQSEQQQNNQG